MGKVSVFSARLLVKVRTGRKPRMSVFIGYSAVTGAHLIHAKKVSKRVIGANNVGYRGVGVCCVG